MAVGAEYGNGWEVQGTTSSICQTSTAAQKKYRRALSIFLKTLRKINCKTLLQGCTKIMNVFII